MCVTHKLAGERERRGDGDCAPALGGGGDSAPSSPLRDPRRDGDGDPDGDVRVSRPSVGFDIVPARISAWWRWSGVAVSSAMVAA